MDLVFARVFWSEFFAIKIADSILGVGGEHHPFFRCLIAIDGQLEHLSALEETRDGTGVFPMLEVFAGVDRYILAEGIAFVKERDDPVLARRIPNEFRVPAGMLDDRVALVVGPRLAAVRRVGQRLAATRVREHEDHGLFLALLPAGTVVGINIAAAGKTLPDGHRGMPVGHVVAVGPQRVGLLDPVNHVGAGGVAPIHVGPRGSSWVALPEEMILAIVVTHAIGVVVPTARLAHVELRPQRFVIERLEVAQLVAGFNHGGYSRIGLGRNHRGLAHIFRHVQPTPPVDRFFVRRKIAIQIVDELVANAYRHPAALTLVRYGENEVFAGNLNFSDMIRRGRRLDFDGWCGPFLGGGVALRDLIDIDVAPSARRVINDLDHDLFALVFFHIPILPVEGLAATRFGVRTCGG